MNPWLSLIGVGEAGSQALRLDSIEAGGAESLEQALASGWIEGVQTDSIEVLKDTDLPTAIAIAKGDVNAINYFVALKYVEAFSKLAESPQQKTVIVPAEMGALVGSIAGISELVKTAQAEQPPIPPRSAATRPSRASGPAVPPTAG